MTRMPDPDSLHHPSKWLVGPPVPTISGISVAALAARACMLSLLLLMTCWLQGYLGGFAWGPVTSVDDPKTNDTGLMFNWHPLLMTLAFGVLMAEAVLAYQSPLICSLNRMGRKKLHSLLHGAAAVCIICALIAVFQSHSLKKPVPVPDLYSAHSFLGMTVVCMVGLQMALGFYSYLFPTIPLSDRIALGPLHRFAGMATWVAGLAAMATGIQEKTTFLQTGMKLSGDGVFSAIMRIPAVMLVLLVLLAIFVLYHQVPPATPKRMNNNDGLVLDSSDYQSLGRSSQEADSAP